MLVSEIILFQDNLRKSFFFSNCTYVEIAKALKLSPATVRNAIKLDSTAKMDTIYRVAEYLDGKRNAS